jgi:hypothetical protein
VVTSSQWLQEQSIKQTKLCRYCVFKYPGWYYWKTIYIKYRIGVVMYFDVCTVHLVQFIIWRPTKVQVHVLVWIINNTLYRVRQKYLTIWQHSCEWNRWHGEFVLESPSSETQSISVAMQCWSVQHRAFAVETYF